MEKRNSVVACSVSVQNQETGGSRDGLLQGVQGGSSDRRA